MALLRRWLAHLPGRGRRGAPGARDDDGLEADPAVEGRLDPNTAALTEGAPPAGADGRVQPSGTSPDPRPPRGPSEGDVQNLPG
ncbi:hypothetical protein ACI8AC_22425 [Geodermatophilus sp. SYSU D00758]